MWSIEEEEQYGPQQREAHEPPHQAHNETSPDGWKDPVVFPQQLVLCPHNMQPASLHSSAPAIVLRKKFKATTHPLNSRIMHWGHVETHSIMQQ